MTKFFNSKIAKLGREHDVHYKKSFTTKITNHRTHLWSLSTLLFQKEYEIMHFKTGIQEITEV